MPRVDFPTIEDTNDFTPLPDGQYTCTLAEIEEDQTRSGDEMWRLRFVVDGGEHAGRYIFDNAVFSQKALPRVKLLCSCLGVDVSRERDLVPADLQGRTVVVSVYVEDYTTDDGQAKQRNRVPWDGYSVAYAGGSAESDKDLPF